MGEGALWGLAWGNALGCPFEGWRASTTRQVFGDYVELPSDLPLQALVGDKQERRRRAWSLRQRPGRKR